MAFLNPTEVLDKINVRENFISADFGSGSGGWVIPLAQRTKLGIVYAIDVLGAPLSILKQKAKNEGLRNVKIIQADIEKGSQLSDDSCDLVLMTNLLFAVEDRKKVLKEGVRILKEGGHLLVVDWEAEAPIQVSDPISSIDLGNMAIDLNLQLVKELPAGIYHWGLIFRK
jgi:ubiquinone/menaquinone biosynthesis C-methylase UbiE